MHLISTKLLAAVFVGGAIGAVARWQAGELLSSDFAPLMLVNLVGSFVIGIVSSLVMSEIMKVFLQTGVLGSFTSMSAVVALVAPELTSAESLMAILITFAVSPVAVLIGKRLTILGAS